MPNTTNPQIKMNLWRQALTYKDDISSLVNLIKSNREHFPFVSDEALTNMEESIQS